MPINGTYGNAQAGVVALSSDMKAICRRASYITGTRPRYKAYSRRPLALTLYSAMYATDTVYSYVKIAGFW